MLACVSSLVIATLAQGGRTQEIITLFDEMRSEGITPTTTTFQKISLAASKTNNTATSITYLESILLKMNDNELRAPIGGPVIESLIKLHGSNGDYQKALATFLQINGPVNEQCLCAILNVCANVSPARWEDAVFLLHSSDIVDDAAGPGIINTRALSYAVAACVKENNWEEALNLLELYARPQLKGEAIVNVDSLNSVIAAAGRSGRPDISVKILSEMESTYMILPDSRSYRSAIIACNQAEHERRRQRIKGQKYGSPLPKSDSCNWDALEFYWWEAALSLFRRMREDGLNPDVQTYSSVISACEAAGEWQRALGVLRTMASTNGGIPPNLFCFNAAIAACEKGGAWLEAVELYERMRSKGEMVRPNFITINSLCIALDKAEQREFATNLYDEAFRDGIVSPWRFSQGHDGKRIRALDLHQFSAPMAKIAVRSAIDSLLLGKSKRSAKADLVIIVGKGNGSHGGKSVLLPVVQHVLREEYGLQSLVDESNSGRLRISRNSLDSFVESKRWRFQDE